MSTPNSATPNSQTGVPGAPALGLFLLLTLSIAARAIAGTAVTLHARAQAAPSKPDISADEQAALMDEGQTVYGRDCAECHAEGGIGAALGGNAKLADTNHVVTRILRGTDDGAMSAFGPSLTDREIAAVATFIRNTWDNEFGATTEAEVKRVRNALAKKK